MTFSDLIGRKVTRTGKKEIKSQKLCLTDYNPLKVQGLWQDYYPIFLIILLNEFMKLNVNTNPMIKKVKIAKLIEKIAIAFLNTQTLKIIS